MCAQVILGTQYAGEMKKGVFTLMHYFMPKRGILSLHSGCNVGAEEDVTLFFGLSGAPQEARPCSQHARSQVLHGFEQVEGRTVGTGSTRNRRYGRACRALE